jgi:hypothetical protein
MENLKRVLTYRKLEIQDPYYSYQYSPSTLKPEAIEIQLKLFCLAASTYTLRFQNMNMTLRKYSR